MEKAVLSPVSASRSHSSSERSFTPHLTDFNDPRRDLFPRFAERQSDWGKGTETGEP